MIRRVPTLDEALSLLDGGVEQLILQSGQPIRTVRGSSEAPTSDRALTAAEIITMLESSPLAEFVPRSDTAGEEHCHTVSGRNYVFRIARFMDLVELRLWLAPAGATASAVPKPVHANDQTVIVTAPKQVPVGGGSPRSGRGAVPAVARGLPGASGKADPGGNRPTREIPAAPSLNTPDRPTRREVAQPDAPGRPGMDPIALPDGLGALELPPLESLDRLELAELTPEPDIAPPSPVGLSTPSPALRPPIAAPIAPTPPQEAYAPRSAPPAAAAPASYTPPAAPTPEATEAAPTGLHNDSQSRLSPAVAELMVAARARGASDVHILSDQPVRIRIAGRLAEAGTTVPAAAVQESIDSLLSPRRAATLQELGYVDLGLTDRRAGRLRINICRHRSGFKLCARLVAPRPFSPSELGLPPEVEAISKHHQGLVICSGPSGAGKTTTMAALVNTFNTHKAVHIITVEDPVEIEFPIAKAVVSQREVGSHTLSFASALKASLREDPDVIVIGELRDQETVHMALAAAETGHLVLATMSTPTGAETIDRLIDMFPPEDQSQVRTTLAGALKLVVSQRLVQATNGALVAAFEVITGNVPLWALIRDAKLFQLPSLLQRGKGFGMVRMDDSLRGLMTAGTISQETAAANASDPRNLGAEAPKPTGAWDG